MYRVHPIGYLTKTTGKRLQSEIGRMPKIVPWCVELEETVGEKTVDEPFSLARNIYIFIYRFVNYFLSL